MNYYCMYCDQRCSKAGTHDDVWTCKTCFVSFYNNENGLMRISFFHSFTDKKGRFEINLYPQLNRTEIICWKPYPPEFTFGGSEPDLRETILDTKALININPTNKDAKLRTILTFQ